MEAKPLSFDRIGACYLEPEMHRALKIKAAESSKSVLEIINEVMHETLRLTKAMPPSIYSSL